METKLLTFLRILREASPINVEIFSMGSCVELYKMVKQFIPEVEMYWSNADCHALIHLNGRFFDIGGEVSKIYVGVKSYYHVLDDSEEFEDLEENCNFNVSLKCRHCQEINSLYPEYLWGYSRVRQRIELEEEGEAA